MAIGAAVIGVGFIGIAHIEALRRIGVDVRGVLGSTPERARAKADGAGVDRVYASLDELLVDPAVQVVHITSPNVAHYEQCLAVIDAGKHLICEKPLALTATETADLSARATTAGIVNAVCFNIRFYPINHQASSMVRAGELGEVLRVSGSYHQDWLLYPTDWNWRVDTGVGGTSRAMADIGSHWLDLVKFITGLRVDAVFADLQTAIPVRTRPIGEVETFAGPLTEATPTEDVAIGTEDGGGVLLRFDGGAKGVLSVSQVNAGRKNAPTWEVACTDGGLAWNGEQPEALWIGHRGRANEVLLRDPGIMSTSARARTDYPGGHAEGFPDTFKQLFRAFYGDVERGGPAITPDYPTFADGHESVALTEAILASARDGRWTEVAK